MKKFTITLLVTIFTFSLYAQNRTEHVDYGQGKAIGFSLFGDPLFLGAAYKIVKDQNQIEINAGFVNRTEVFNVGSNDFDIESNAGFGVTGGYNFFLGSKNKERKHKIVKNYLSLKLGASITDVSELKPTICWRKETFREEEHNYSRGFDLGLTYARVLGNSLIRQGDDLVNSYATLFIRFDWNWYRP